MKRRTRNASLVLILALAALPASAAGAGGLLLGQVEPAWNPSWMPAVPDSARDLEYLGGFGYGVDADGMITGGFGLAFLDYESFDPASWDSAGAAPRHLAGGVGGMVLGSRFFGGREAHLDLAARLGVGGVGISDRTGSAGAWSYVSTGYAIAYAEPYLELGLGLAPWLQLSATLGYHIMGNFLPGKAFSDFVYYAPTIGLTFGFGSF